MTPQSQLFVIFSEIRYNFQFQMIDIYIYIYIYYYQCRSCFAGKVLLRQKYSEYSTLHCGIPYRSTRGPLLLLIYTLMICQIAKKN